MSLNPLLLRTAAPPIPEARAWAARYRGALGPLIDLSQAVPGRPPPDALLERLARAAASPEASRYGAITGDADLVDAYAAHVGAAYGGRIDAAEIAVTAGCNQAFFVAMILLARAGEAVLLPCPWYFNHKMTLDMLGIEARPLPCAPDDGFVPDVERAERLIDSRVRAIVLVSPNNPTGAIYPPAVIEAFHALCERRGLTLVVDETYRDFIDPAAGRPHGLLASAAWRGSLVQLYSFSKAYGIPGHRIGAMIADRATVAEIAKILDCMQICASRAPQMALAWAIEGLAAWRAAQTRDILARLAAFRDLIAPVRGWPAESLGAYFAYVRHPAAGRAAGAVAERLAENCGVLGLPGSYFGPGQETHLRLAFANVGVEAIGALPERLAAFRPEAMEDA